MRVGLLVPMFGQLCDIGLLRDFALSAEQQGFDSLWVSDHVVLPQSSKSEYAYLRSKQYRSERGEQKRADRWDAAATLAYLAAITSRVTIGTSVYIVPNRHPLVSAKAFSSLDVMSNGRLEVGIGAGWLAEEFEALAVPFEERGTRTDETLAIWRQAWTGRTVSYQGRHFSVEGVSMEPAPVRGYVPLAIGGHSRATLRRIVENRAGWHAVTESPDHCYGWTEDFPAAIAQVTDAWRARYDDGSLPEVSGVIIDGPASDPDQLAGKCEEYARLGVHRLILDFPAARATDAVQLMTLLDRLAGSLPLTAPTGNGPA